MNVEICDGLEAISRRAFASCESLERILIPSTVKTIDFQAFSNCTKLRNVELCDGLVKIDNNAFENCALESIKIPASVQVIYAETFEDCRSLVSVQFCDVVEELVSRLFLQEWWGRGVPGPSLDLYAFFVLHDIPERLGMLKAEKWRNDVLNRLAEIPFRCECCSIDDFCHPIHFKLEYYQELQKASSELELALWKAKLTEHGKHDGKNDERSRIVTRSEVRMNCGAAVIIPLVLSFLVGSCTCSRCNDNNHEDDYDIIDSDDEMSSSSDEDEVMDDDMDIDEDDGESVDSEERDSEERVDSSNYCSDNEDDY